MGYLLKTATNLAIGSCVALCAFAAPEIQLGNTTFIGRAVGPGVDFFGGIPFAAPPIGALRFQSPLLKKSHNYSRFDATDYGKACLQPPVVPDLADTSEDCLTVNVHRPETENPGERLPVLLWVYGGGFLIGGARVYNGSEIVAHSIRRGTPIIYVNFNYRLGPLGYPRGNEAHQKRRLNLALEDIHAALKWVYANIHAFGGDKHKITIFGESAGGMNIGILLLNRQFERLVRGAIFQSGQASGPPAFKASERESIWQDFVRSVPSCATVASSGNTFGCLQNVSETEMASAYMSYFGADPFSVPWDPILDHGRGGLLPDFASTIYKDGSFAKIPFISGTNLDEGTIFAGAARSPNFTQTDLKDFLIATSSPPISDIPEEALEESVDKLLKLYPDTPALGSPYGTGDELFGLPSIYKRTASILGDLIFDAPRRQWMEAAADNGVTGYGYLFTQPQPQESPESGVPHGAEIPFVYGNTLDMSPSAVRLKEMMMDYWISFAVSLDPNDDKGSKRPIWPRYTKSNRGLLHLNGNDMKIVEDDFRKHQLRFLMSNSLAFRR
ncbi:triacylglycerol lipase 3 [Coprinopsis marcescibilis]|uniref:Carboxylic ester hydrolase n=1 Tax=Coprinopsis marcescibilis TaxID=230819 RepID=A0A5C3KWD3_COPMA|nr:triacylglycerol lipase 3 [Coprinopsis marcescibilis]